MAKPRASSAAVTGLTVRDAARADLPTLVALSRKTFTDKFGMLYDPADLAAFLEESHSEAAYRAYLEDRRNLVRVASLGGGELGAYLLCGALSLPARSPLPGAVELKRLYVAQPLQGAGLGTQLVAKALDWAQTVGAPEIYLSVYSGNFGAQRFYARHGWEKVGEFIFPVGQHEDLEFLMRRPL